MADNPTAPGAGANTPNTPNPDNHTTPSFNNLTTADNHAAPEATGTANAPNPIRRRERGQIHCEAVAILMCKFNRGSADVYLQLMNHYNIYQMQLPEQIMRDGSELWVLYKDMCGEDIQATVAILNEFRRKGVAAEQVGAALRARDVGYFAKFEAARVGPLSE